MIYFFSMVQLSTLIDSVNDRFVREGFSRLRQDSFHDLGKMLQLCDFVMDLRVREKLQREVRMRMKLMRFEGLPLGDAKLLFESVVRDVLQSWVWYGKPIRKELFTYIESDMKLCCMARLESSLCGVAGLEHVLAMCQMLQAKM